MTKIPILYGPMYGKTEEVAKLITSLLPNSELIPMNLATKKTLENYSFFICGLPTVGRETWASEINNECANFIQVIKTSDLSGKTFACFGLGDHISYPNNFVDSLGELVTILKNRGAKVVGKVPSCEYEFHDSRALEDNYFVGLPLDHDFEPEKSKNRIKNWIEKIMVQEPSFINLIEEA